MSESTDKLCFGCNYRERVMGSAHSRCRHPSVSKTTRGELLAMLAGSVFVELESARDLDIQANSHGVRMGWFNWPYDFDPLWLENCNGFQSSEAVE